MQSSCLEPRIDTLLGKLKAVLGIAILVAALVFFGDAVRRICSMAEWFLHLPDQDAMRCNAKIDHRVIDLSGDEVQGPTEIPYDYGHDFRNGPALHLDEADFLKPHLLDPGKREVFIRADKHGGEWVIMSGERPKRYYVTAVGTRAFAQDFRVAQRFSEGLAAVSDGVDEAPDRTGRTFFGPYHYINTDGQEAFSGEFSTASEFHHGRAIVTTYTSDRKERMCIDTNGQEVFDCSDFTDVQPFSDDGYAVVHTKDDPELTGLIDSNGNMILKGVDLKNFSEGLGAFRDRQSALFGYINKTGTVVIPPTFLDAEEFSQGFAVVGLRDVAPVHYQHSTCAKIAYGFVDKSGKILPLHLSEPRRDVGAASNFRGGLSSLFLLVP